MVMRHSLIDKVDVEGKTVLVRIDINLPISKGRITDFTRVYRSLQTLRYLVSKGAKIIILSHRGRPNGIFNRNLSLASFVDVLEAEMNQKISFCSDILNKNILTKINKMQKSEILLLENLRFNKGEEKNDPKFSKLLGSFADIYVNDTFSCSHRTHASIVGITDFLPSYAGFLLDSELRDISSILSLPKRPLVAIIGGSKVNSKMNLLLKLSKKVDYLIITGLMCNAFLSANGYDLDDSEVSDQVSSAKAILSNFGKAKLILPTDLVTFKNKKEVNVVLSENIKRSDGKVYDIGPKSVFDIINVISKCKTLIWNGPLGRFEDPKFAVSTFDVARHVAYATKTGNLVSVVGGGDTLAALRACGLQSYFSYVCTGGGAFLDWLENPDLPGVQALIRSKK